MPSIDGTSAGSDHQKAPLNPIATPANSTTTQQQHVSASETLATTMTVELDDFGLPVRKYPAATEKAAASLAEVEPAEPKTEDATTQNKRVPGESGASQPKPIEDQAIAESKKTLGMVPGHRRDESSASHQQLTSYQPAEKKDEEDDDGGWQDMPSYAPYDIYDDNNKLIAREYHESEDEKYGYAALGGAGKGYTKILDDDAESVTSMDENMQYLFKEMGPSTSAMDDEQRDAVSQLQATKELLTEGQRIAYVGLTRLELNAMIQELESLPMPTSKVKKYVGMAAENMKMWAQRMMIRLYTHMDISPDEQVMIEQLSSHGVQPRDLTPVLMANARVKNPMVVDDDQSSTARTSSSSRPSSVMGSEKEPRSDSPPPYSAEDTSELKEEVRTPSQMPTTQKIDIDIRWTVLCDLFLVLVADSIYDARSRTLLERVAKDLDISWLDICRFEKKVTDALEMQQSADKENWNEQEHMENRRKMALKKRYMMVGLATVGGGLVIGLSAGLLAPVIGAGLAAGFTAIGVSGTGTFLAGAGGAAIITSTAAASGSVIGGRAADRRTGAVKTFEYRPLNNNKRVNLIVTVSGWMTGKVDDVRLPFSTVDPIMGDIYSVLWEPEMLATIGATINILATEALTQGLQQLLGNTILVSLMAAIQIPVILTKLAYLIDNPWAVSLDRAEMAGLILADSLIDRNLGTRPVTLVGYSLGSRVIFSCLQELARKGAFGLVQNVYLFGSPIVVKKDEYLRARAVVSGRFLNGYNRNDWILGYLFRLTSGGIRRVAGLAAIEDIPGIENMDVSDLVVGHMDYRTAMPRLLRECGWMVESDEFTEIEDPDPDGHRERQRELINEIEEARRELEKESKQNKSSGFAFWKRRKVPERQEWEVYEDTMKAGNKGKSEEKDGVLFDVDAIRAEIAKERKKNKGGIDPLDEQLLQIREIKSTLPPIKVELNKNNTPTTTTPPPPPTAKAKSSRCSLADGSIMTDLSRSSSSHQTSTSSPKPTGRDRAPTFPSSKVDNTTPSSTSSPYRSYGHGFGGFGGGYVNYGEPEDPANDGITMTFDTGFDDDRDRQGDKDSGPGLFSPQPASLNAGISSDASGSGAGNSSSMQPPESILGLTKPATVPNITLADPWRDAGYDDDEEFGKEKEISLTFA